MNPTNQPTVVIDNLPRTLADLERDAWKQLVSAPQRKKDGFKTCTIATRLDDGADARTVVLRQADEVQKCIWFHTDRRAGKVTQLKANPQATLLFWDDDRQIQLRLVVRTTIHLNDNVADEQWQKLWVGGRKTYLSEQQPGSGQPGPYPGFPERLGEELPSQEESEAGRVNFAVIACQVLRMDYLHLSRAGQTRAQFTYQGDETGRQWLAP
ncbi:pyridoxamine 5'-phosphate oxidase [Fibrisoma montanum]|uniref:Pyridoxamine 5'-phosphate oxidase n=1 Tax=Fibrisoma montanum TaxID=2305895 RepID=A0A418ME95_9BACT|nr:pyridoxamine 5'-phosphate oxidase family protein [Fibrisoma montanum]RIV25130.1 pyridoxamine 5'-phosphate oxidase [Fibrisoma montanum]